MPRPSNQPPSKPFGYTEHVDFETRRIIAGEEVTVDGHTFLVQAFDYESAGLIQPPHLGGKQDAFSIVGRVGLKLEHAPWRGCPALDADKPSRVVPVPCEAFDALVRIAQYVSLGRSAVDHQPDSAPYPDSTARRALGALDGAGLLPIGESE